MTVVQISFIFLIETLSSLLGGEPKINYRRVQKLRQKILERFTKDEVQSILDRFDQLDLLENEAEPIKFAIIDLAQGRLKAFQYLAKIARRKPKEILQAHQKWIEYETIKDDIPIEKKMSIKWVKFDSKNTPSKRIDALIKPVQPLFDKLEINCDRLCCGIKAFNFHPESIRKASISLGDSELANKLDELSKRLNNVKEEIVICGSLNQLFHKSVFQELLNHLQLNVTK